MQQLALFDGHQHQDQQHHNTFIVSPGINQPITGYLPTLASPECHTAIINNNNNSNNSNHVNEWMLTPASTSSSSMSSTSSPSPSPTTTAAIGKQQSPYQQAFFPDQVYSMTAAVPMEHNHLNRPNHLNEMAFQEPQSKSVSSHETPKRDEMMMVKSGSKKKKSGKSTYKHVPHREKPIHLVARRNARERRRVQAVNSAFARLRKCVPFENRNKRLSKVKTLHRAIEYIAALQDVLRQADDADGIHRPDDIMDHQMSVKSECESMDEIRYNKENDDKWLTIDDCQHQHHHQHHQCPASDPYLNGFACNYRYLKCLP